MSVVTITKENFESEVKNETKPVLIDFWASWCMPCKMMSPVVDKLAEENINAKVCKVNVDEQPELAEQFQVMSIPTLLFFKEGEVAKKMVGVQDENDLRSVLQEL